MSKIKVAELFYSIQGEGRYMGVPSVFLRTFGCNFKCAGFGMPKGQLSTEADEVARTHQEIETFFKYKDLPLVKTGCDSYASWHPAFKDLSPTMEIDGLVDKILDLLPYKDWCEEHLVITGGEPLLGWQRSYPALLSHKKMNTLRDLTFETNGTQMLTDDFTKYLEEEWYSGLEAPSGREITFSVSPKLSSSGEKAEDAIKPEVIEQYQRYGYTYLKFVVATEEDAIEAFEALEKYRKADFYGPVYLMPVGGVEEVYKMNNRRVAEYALKMGLRYSDRLQVPLFKNEWGT